MNWKAIGVALLIAWVLGFVVFKVAGFFIHLLLILAVIMLVRGMLRKKQL